jgi:hypothetical protein
LHRIYHTSEFGKEVVAGRIHYPASVLLDQIRDDPFVSLQGPHGCGLILTHEAAVSYYVGAEDGSKFAFETFCGHGIASQGSLEVGRIKSPGNVN